MQWPTVDRRPAVSASLRDFAQAVGTTAANERGHKKRGDKSPRGKLSCKLGLYAILAATNGSQASQSESKQSQRRWFWDRLTTCDKMQVIKNHPVANAIESHAGNAGVCDTMKSRCAARARCRDTLDQDIGRVIRAIGPRVVDGTTPNAKR